MVELFCCLSLILPVVLMVPIVIAWVHWSQGQDDMAGPNLWRGKVEK